MPAPAQAQAQQQQGQQPAQQPQDDDGDLIAVIVAALAAYMTVKALTGALRAPFKAAGISGAALSAVASLALTWPQEAMEGTGPAQRWAIRANLVRRASFFLHAARRTQQAIVSARSQGKPVLAAVGDALTAEKRWLAQHIAASTARVKAAAAVDGLAAVHGDLLGWNTVVDSHTTAECLAAAGMNFKASRPPVLSDGTVAYPGGAHGSTCRCFPSAPHRGARVLPSSLARRRFRRHSRSAHTQTTAAQA
jgi:hypothetical protein